MSLKSDLIISCFTIWPTGCVWHYYMCIWKANSSHLALWPIACEWIFSESQFHHNFFYWWTVGMWHKLHICGIPVNIDATYMLWPIECEWHNPFSENQFHCILFCGQQDVSNIGFFQLTRYHDIILWLIDCMYILPILEGSCITLQPMFWTEGGWYFRLKGLSASCCPRLWVVLHIFGR